VRRLRTPHHRAAKRRGRALHGFRGFRGLFWPRPRRQTCNFTCIVRRERVRFLACAALKQTMQTTQTMQKCQTSIVHDERLSCCLQAACENHPVRRLRTPHRRATKRRGRAMPRLRPTPRARRRVPRRTRQIVRSRGGGAPRDRHSRVIVTWSNAWSDRTNVEHCVEH
jgi:hypothetical protein